MIFGLGGSVKLRNTDRLQAQKKCEWLWLTRIEHEAKPAIQ